MEEPLKTELLSEGKAQWETGTIFEILVRRVEEVSFSFVRGDVEQTSNFFDGWEGAVGEIRVLLGEVSAVVAAAIVENVFLSDQGRIVFVRRACNKFDAVDDVDRLRKQQ